MNSLRILKTHDDAADLLYYTVPSLMSEDDPPLHKLPNEAPRESSWLLMNMGDKEYLRYLFSLMQTKIAQKMLKEHMFLDQIDEVLAHIGDLEVPDENRFEDFEIVWFLQQLEEMVKLVKDALNVCSCYFTSAEIDLRNENLIDEALEKLRMISDDSEDYDSLVDRIKNILQKGKSSIFQRKCGSRPPL